MITIRKSRGISIPRIATLSGAFAVAVGAILLSGSTATAFQKGGGSTPPADPAIVYIKNGTNGRHELFAINADGTNASSILQGSAGTIYNLTNVTLSPNGTSVAFVGYTFNSAYHLRVLDIAVVAGKPVGQNLRTIYSIPMSEGEIWSPQWSPSGAEIAFHQKGAIYSIPAAGGVPTPIFTFDSEYGPGNITWSPDGTKLAVASFSTLYTVDRTAGTVINVLHTLQAPYRFISASWGRTNNKLAVDVINVDQAGYDSAKLYAIDAGGPGPLQLLRSAAYLPVWSPDDSQIVFISRSSKWPVSVLNIATGVVKSFSGTNCRFPDWRRS